MGGNERKYMERGRDGERERERVKERKEESRGGGRREKEI